MYKVLEVNVDDHLYGGVYALITCVIRMMPSDIKVDIAALEPFDRQEHIAALREYDCDVYYVGSGGNKIKKQFTIYNNMRKLISQNKYDVVHLHSDVAHKILVSALAAKKCGVKRIIFHSHANDVEGKHVRLRRLFHKLCTVLLKSIPAVYLATSQESGKWMYPWAEKGTVRIQNNGIDYERFYYNPSIRDAVRTELKRENAFLLGAFGRFVYPKNPFYLLDIFSRVHEVCPEAHLLCIGQGPLREEFEQKAEELGLTEYLTIIDNTDRIDRYYQALDVLLLPSRFEGFGLVAVEGQVSGTPVVASENVPEMTKISNDITYLPIEPDAVETWSRTICSYRDHVKRDTRSDINRVYDIHNIVGDLERLYRV